MRQGELVVVRAQAGPQEACLASAADIAIYGGAAGGGKTFALLLEPLRHIHNPQFGAVIFRRTFPQVTNQGGLWDQAMRLYPLMGSKPKQTRLEHEFPSGARVRFAHMQYEADRLAWQGSQVPLIGWDELTHFCYNPVMETLTETGWKRIGDVRPGERVLALTPDWHTRYELVTAAWEFDYDGELLETSNRSIRYSVTPNHRMVIQRQGHTDWEFCEAQELDRFPLFPFSADWEGEEREWVELPVPTGRGLGRNQNAVERTAADDYLAFLGWYFAEGSAFLANERKTSPCIMIRQTKDNAELAALFERLPFKSRYTPGEGYRIFSRQLYEHVKPWGNLYQKRVPRWVMQLSQRQLMIFLHAFALGDGQFIKNGAIAFGLANEGLVDDLQEIAAKLGYRSVKGRGIARGKYTVHRLYIHARRGGNVQDRPQNKRRVPYRGKVNCITVEPSHTLLCRHEGRVSWSGNSESQFFYMLSRNRSTCGVRPYVRATCNPDADSWAAGLIAWWIDQATGYPIPERAGRLRWFVRLNDELIWADSADELKVAGSKHCCKSGELRVAPKSLTFIPARLQDNPALLRADPGYLANLMALPLVERERLLGGNWKIRPTAGKVFNRAWFEIVDAAPAGGVECRFWDFAGTARQLAKPDPDFTASVRIRRAQDGIFYILDSQADQIGPAASETQLRNISRQDAAAAGAAGARYMVRWELEPGAAAIRYSRQLVAALAPLDAAGKRSTGDKLVRAKGLAAQAQAGNVRLLRGAWNEQWLRHMHGQPDLPHDDTMDASTGAFNELANSQTPMARSYFAGGMNS